VTVVNSELMQTLGVQPDAFDGRTAVITGSARGIGKETALNLGSLGARVVVVDIRSQGADVATAIDDAGGHAVFVQCDLADLAQLEEAISNIASAVGEIDILINNALHLKAAPVVEIPLDDWEQTFRTNARAPFLLIQGLLPGMLERRRGTIVNMVAYEGTPFAGAYSGTKLALRSLAQSVAREIGNESGVSVFSFVPGIVDTPLMREDVIPEMAKVFGMSEDQVLDVVAHNPGYEGFMPVDHCAAALVYALAHAEEYHGQVADPFEPLDRAGVIEMPRVETGEEIDVSGPLSGIYIKQYLGEVSSTNKALEHRIEVRTRELADARDRSEQLLLSILPPPIARRLEAGEELIADYFDDATVLFADIVGFTSLSATMTPPRVVQLLDVLFSRFDSVADRYDVEKIKTNGDSYMAVGGVPIKQGDHLERVARMALELLPVIDAVGIAFDLPLSARIGIHSGNVVAGVIGRQRFIYDLWGDTVNTASRMESYGEGGRIHCSDVVRSRLAESFSFEPRGVVEIKGKGTMSTYSLTGART
jgi:NAD(P)-dependent dehydrogenase (short-subunit alcohol dehydrogenase family)/class 3 adenylate cyclase